MKPLIAHYLDSASFGGTESIAVNLVKQLSCDWQTVLLHHADAPVQLRRAAATAGLELVEVPRVTGAAGMVRAREVLRHLRPAIFHAQRPWPIECETWLASARLAGAQAVVTTEQLFPERLPRRSIIRERLLDPLLHMRIAVSEHVADLVRRTFGTPARKVRVVTNGIDPRPFETASGDGVRDELCAHGQPLVLTVAHLRRQKGLDVLIEAAAALPGAMFVVAGDGPDRAALQHTIDDAGLAGRFRLLGPRDDIPRLLAGCDLFVLPSRNEGLPLAMLEAMAARRPVIGTHAGGIPEVVVDGQHGRLVATDNAAELAAAIASLLANPAEAARLAERGHARVIERFTSDRMTSEISAIYEALLPSR